MKVKDILSGITNGSIVLPDFQRSFVWEPDNVRELIVSLLGDYFIGSMLTLESLRDDALFALKPLEGVKRKNKAVEVQSQVQILLDGQQRATALFYALEEPDIPLKNRKNPYKTYVDLDKALDGNWDPAVLIVNVANKKMLNEIKANSSIIPLGLFQDIGKLVERFQGDNRLKDIIDLANDLMQREIHMVPLPRDTSLEKIVETFERVNRYGQPLSTFDLIAARLYRKGIRLRDFWQTAQEDYSFARVLEPESVLRVIALLRGKGTKRKALLELEPEHFKEDWRRAVTAMRVAYDRTTSQAKGYGVFDFKKWMPYSTMMVPLAVIIDFIRSNKLQAKENWDKIDRWYWASVFSNRYDEGAVSKQESDYIALRKWVRDESKIPNFIEEFDTNKIDLSVEKQNAAIYRGVIALCVLAGALDFETGQPPQFDELNVQDDHIFPKSIYADDSILNKTLITTNSQKSNKKPSSYFKDKLQKHGEKELKRILGTHIIPGDALGHLLNDNLHEFAKARKRAITKTIKGKAEGKS